EGEFGAGRRAGRRRHADYPAEERRLVHPPVFLDLAAGALPLGDCGRIWSITQPQYYPTTSPFPTAPPRSTARPAEHHRPAPNPTHLPAPGNPPATRPAPVP